MIRIRGVLTLGLLATLAFMSSTALAGSKIEKKHFGTTQAGEAVEQYILSNTNGASVSLITYGATVTQINVPDKAGKIGDVVLGFSNLKQYENESPYFGCIVGRVGNRIAKGRFTIDKQQYALALNNGTNHHHGGFKGYDKRIWKAEAAMTCDGPAVRFTLHDPDGAEGYPGNLDATVIYTLTGGQNTNGLKIQCFATTDHATPVNLTNHTYFNLKDAGKTDVFGHILQANADHYTPVDDTMIPTGQIAPVQGTPIDFTKAKPIGKDLKAMGGDPAGYDHTLVLRSQDGSMAQAATVYEPQSGRRLEVWTTQPGMQFYTSNFLDGSIKGKHDTIYRQYSALCLETQHFPDSINHPNFPSSVLEKGQVYRQVTEFRFSVGEK